MSRLSFARRWLCCGLASFAFAYFGISSSAFSTDLKFASVALRSDRPVRVSVPLSESEKLFVAEGGNAVPPYTVATLAVPRGFDPKKTWPVLIAFSSSDRQYPNWFDLLAIYRRPAIAEGWVLLAGDGPDLPSRVDSSGWRAGHALAALDALHRSFPGSTKWPIAVAGQSGGAKRSTYLAPLFAARGYRIAGIFLEGINEERITEAWRRFRPGSSFLRTRIFLSSGDEDKIATPAQQYGVENSIRRSGFTNLRHKRFPGGHTVLPSHVHEALRWFREGA